MDQSDLEFVIYANSDKYIYTKINFNIRGKLTMAYGKYLNGTDKTVLMNNFRHSLLSQCGIPLNDVTITLATDLYNYPSFFETILTYGIDAAASRLTNSFCYLGDGDVYPPPHRRLRKKQRIQYPMEPN